MLLHLHIKNFAIVPELDQEFRPGFTAISGETGAGKSIMVDALGLLLGDRSDSSWVRAGAERAELSADFDLSGNTAAAQWLAEQDLQDDHQCLLRRTIQASGRSRAWINGTPVTISQLAELGHQLVEVHGQNEHIRLTGQARQLALLDQSGGYEAAREQVAAAHAHWQTLHEELEALEAASALAPAEAEFLGFQLEELEEHALAPDAVAALEQEHRLLSASGDLMAALDQTQALLDTNESNANQLLNQAKACLAPYRALDPSIAEVLDMLHEAQINTAEAITTLSGSMTGVDMDPGRLGVIEQQLSQLAALARKHGTQMESLEATRDEIAQRLKTAADAGSRVAELHEALEHGRAQYLKAAEKLSRARRKHAQSLSRKTEALMQELGMEGGKLQITISTEPDAEPTVRGIDQVSMEVSANAGMPLAPLSKVASGGELSRISLAIKVATAGAGTRTQVFDEIDTGVGGATANAVGQLLSQAARGGQALCVTHLAQVAVRADQQLRVMKQSGDNETSIQTRVLDEDARVEEIARMLGGNNTAQSQAHAREMLEGARSTIQ